MDAGVVFQFGVVVGARGVGDVVRVELVDDGLRLRDVHAGPGAGAVAMDQRGQCADRRDPADHVVGKDGRGVVEPVSGAGVV